MVTVGQGYRQQADKEATINAFLKARYEGKMELVEQIEKANPGLYKVWHHVGRIYGG